MSEERLELVLRTLLHEHREEINQLFVQIKNVTEDINEKLSKLDFANTLYGEKLVSISMRVIANERYLKKNNIIVHGILENSPEDIVEVTIGKLNALLGVKLLVNDINNIYRIGKSINGKPRPILVQFISFLKKQSLYVNIGNLKNYGVAVSNDLIKEDYNIRKELLTHLKQARQKKPQD